MKVREAVFAHLPSSQVSSEDEHPLCSSLLLLLVIVTSEGANHRPTWTYESPSLVARHQADGTGTASPGTEGLLRVPGRGSWSHSSSLPFILILK